MTEWRGPWSRCRRIQPHGDLAFNQGDGFPTLYRGLFVAFHGSWNRSVPTQAFATGWLVSGKALGRPVGLTVGADGAPYDSDDTGGRIYHITYTG